ncbi:uncharacterized protein ISCGN_001253 [Ixodes scapularis]
MRFLFPGHRCLGPGNPLNNGEPVDEDDSIAREHDRRYSDAETDQDVFAADKDAKHDFVCDWADRGSFHSLVGAAGLGVKNLVEEKVLGRSLYGRSGAMSGRKRSHGECSGSSPEFKKLYGNGVANFVNEALYSGERARADSTTGNEEEEQSQALRNEGGAGIGSNAANDGVVEQQILRIPRDKGMVRVHRDSKLLRSRRLRSRRLLVPNLSD